MIAARMRLGWLQDGGPGRVCSEVVNYDRAFLYVVGPPNTTHITQEMDEVILAGLFRCQLANLNAVVCRRDSAHLPTTCATTC
jgi:hypothetical protein